MPELPEVETIARMLRGGSLSQNGREIREKAASAGSIIGHTILSVDVHWPKTIAAPEGGFDKLIAGQRIESVGRRAKYLVIQLSEDVLVIHLRMSGDIQLRPSGEPAAVHDRVIFHLDDGLDMAFNDTRKFGRVWLLEDTFELFNNLGPEPLGNDFTASWLYDELQRRNRQIKPLLLDQKFLAGVGNIYADESLHRAGIHPLRRSGSITKAEAGRLRQFICEVLEEGIRSNGASIDWVYRGGEFQNQFNVYGRTGEDCPRCHAAIEKIVVGQRGTHFCPKCQAAPAVESQLG